MGLWNLKHINDLYNHIRKTYDAPEILKDSKWWLEFFKKAIKVEEFRMAMKKTYLVGLLTFALGGLKAMGWIDETAFQTILVLLGGAGIMTMRAAISKNGMNK